ncbi:MAG: hypothetical protein JNK23_02975 [Opitutaceae bacterium]|nr:hypothetical protein [Opitutaceae bacterium]
MSHLVAPIPPPATVSAQPTAAPDWIDVARLCRRICLLVERGEIAEADRLRTGEFSAAVSALRAAGTDGAMFAIEAERLAHATLIAEFLAPLLAARLQPAARRDMPAPSLARIAALTPEPAAPARSAAPGNIADFIDEMLAREHPAPASRDQRAS